MIREQLNKQLKKLQLLRYEKEIEALAKPCIRLYLTKAGEAAIPIGASKMGGLPDLPDSIAWPYETELPPEARHRFFGNKPKGSPLAPLSFIAQIDLADVKPFDEEGLLPLTGILYFFYSDQMQVWGFDPEDRCGFKVLYFDGDITELKRREIPEAAEITVFNSAKISSQSEISFPISTGIQFLKSDDYDRYFGMMDSFPVNKMLGHADPVQDVMEEECETMRNRIFRSEPVANKGQWRKALKENAKDWRLLLQVDSNDKDCGMMWGDAGLLYYWIRKDDLQARDFDKSWLILQCS